VAKALDSREDAQDSYLTRLEQASLVTSLANLLTFPFIRSRIEAGQIELHGAYFDVADGELAEFDQATGRFIAIKPPSASLGSACD
jgi:carbonic anhydrase